MAFSFQSPELSAWAAGFPILLLHLAVSLAILAAGAAVYAFLTPHREIELIRQGNPAAALSFGGMLASLALPLAFGLAAATSALGVAIWGVTIVVVQLFLFWLTDLVLQGLPQRIGQGDVAAAALLVAAKLATAVLLAAAVAA